MNQSCGARGSNAPGPACRASVLTRERAPRALRIVNGSGRQDSNLRSLAPETSALPAEPRPEKFVRHLRIERSAGSVSESQGRPARHDASECQRGNSNPHCPGFEAVASFQLGYVGASAEREDRTLLGLLVGQVSSPEGEPRAAPEEGFEPPLQRFKVARPTTGPLRIVSRCGRSRTVALRLMGPGVRRGSQRLRRPDSNRRSLGYEPSELATAPLRDEKSAATRVRGHGCPKAPPFEGGVVLAAFAAESRSSKDGRDRTFRGTPKASNLLSLSRLSM